MRDIKFRGKDVKGNWVFGNLHVHENTHDSSRNLYYIIRPCFVPALTMPADNYIEVDPETVGQYTENKDITRTKELYVGDIVQAPRNCKTLCVIKFKPHVGFYAERKGGVYVTGLSLDECLWKGNIHEHPNLLTNE